MRYSIEFKKAVVQRHNEGEFIQALSKELHIAPSTLYQWRKLYQLYHSPAYFYTPAEYDGIVRRLRKAEHKLSIIQNSQLISDVPLKKRLSILENMHQENRYTVHEICEALEVSRGTFYNHIFRRADPSRRMEEQRQLALQIQQVFHDSSQRFGAEKIRIVLAENGIKVSKKRISSIMRELNLQSVRTDAKKQYEKTQQSHKENMLKRTFSANAPNQIWVSDITSFKVNNYFLHLCVFLDIFSRRIVGYKVSRNLSTHIVTSTFRNAYTFRDCPKNLIIHSDRGAQYTSKAFCKLIKDNHIKQSFSASGKPIDNAVAESFFTTFKKEEAYRRNYYSEAEFRKSVDNYIAFYNYKRPHFTLKYKTPVSFEENYYQQFQK